MYVVNKVVRRRRMAADMLCEEERMERDRSNMKHELLKQAFFPATAAVQASVECGLGTEEGNKSDAVAVADPVDGAPTLRRSSTRLKGLPRAASLQTRQYNSLPTTAHPQVSAAMALGAARQALAERSTGEHRRSVALHHARAHRAFTGSGTAPRALPRRQRDEVNVLTSQLQSIEMRALRMTWRKIKGPSVRAAELMLRRMLGHYAQQHREVRDLFYKAAFVSDLNPTHSTLGDHARLIADFYENIIEYINEMTLILPPLPSELGGKHAHMKAYGLHRNLWEDLGERLSLIIGTQESVRACSPATRAWNVIIAWSIDYFIAGYETAVEQLERHEQRRRSMSRGSSLARSETNASLLLLCSDGDNSWRQASLQRRAISVDPGSMLDKFAAGIEMGPIHEKFSPILDETQTQTNNGETHDLNSSHQHAASDVGQNELAENDDINLASVQNRELNKSASASQLQHADLTQDILLCEQPDPEYKISDAGNKTRQCAIQTSLSINPHADVDITANNDKKSGYHVQNCDSATFTRNSALRRHSRHQQRKNRVVIAARFSPDDDSKLSRDSSVFMPASHSFHSPLDWRLRRAQSNDLPSNMGRRTRVQLANRYPRIMIVDRDPSARTIGRASECRGTVSIEMLAQALQHGTGHHTQLQELTNSEISTLYLCLF